MRKLLLLAVMLATSAAAQASDRRCGWLHNPTPANWSLIDRAGEWVISEQGRYHAKGADDMPDMSTRGWVTTNGSYG